MGFELRNEIKCIRGPEINNFFILRKIILIFVPKSCFIFGWSRIFMMMMPDAVIINYLEEFDYVWMVESFHDPHFAEQFLKAARVQLDNKS